MPTHEEREEFEASLEAIRAAGLAERLSDGMTVFLRETRNISTAAAELTLAVLIDADPVGKTYALAAQAADLETKMRAFLETQQAALADVVAAQMKQQRRDRDSESRTH